MAQSWTIDTSIYSSRARRKIAGSSLVFDGGTLTWSPRGFGRNQPGGRAFRAPVGDQGATTLIRLSGTVAVSARGGVDVSADVLAVCQGSWDDPAGPRPYGYVPNQVLEPAAPGLPAADAHHEQTILHEIVQATGLRVQSYELEYGADPSKLFPGIGKSFVRMAVWVAWSTSLVYLLTGLGVLIAAPFGSGVVVLVPLGLLSTALGVIWLPPVFRRLPRRRSSSSSSPADPAATAGR